MEVSINTLSEGSFYTIRDHRYLCHDGLLSPVKPNPAFTICMVRKGFFRYLTFKRNEELHVGRVLISKPDCEYQFSLLQNQPEVATFVVLKAEFYATLLEQCKKIAGGFLHNPDVHAAMVSATPLIEFLHRKIWESFNYKNQLLLDELILELLDAVLTGAPYQPMAQPLPTSLQKLHLGTLEKARDFIFTHFAQNIGLAEIADYCCTSMFHFARVFKQGLQLSPHQYLLEVRLLHAKVLLQKSGLSVTEAAYQSGFNSVEYFATVYRARFGHVPRHDRTPAIKSKNLKMEQPVLH